MGPLNPSQWEGVGVGTVVLIFGLLAGWAIVRGWIVPGPAHREILAGRDASIKALEAREHSHLEIIDTLTKTVAEQSVGTAVSEHLLASIREIAGRPT